MSKILWKSLSIPEGENLLYENYTIDSVEPHIEVRGVRCFSLSNKELLGEKKQLARSSARSFCLIKHSLDSLPESLQKNLQVNPFRVGVYCGVENGSVDYETVQTILNKPDSLFHSEYRMQRNPKMYLKQLPNLAAAQVGILLGLHGPTYIFTHSRLGSLQALEQAEFDLEVKNVDYALVCSSFSNEDRLNLKKNKGKKELSECGVSAVITRGEKEKNIEITEVQYDYGVATKLVEKLNFKEIKL